MVDNAQFEVIRIIDAQPNVSQRQLAQLLGWSVGKANYCLRALIRKGFVKVENYHNSQNKVAYLYLLTPQGVTVKGQMLRHFLARKMKEYDELRTEIEALRKEGETLNAGDPRI